MKTIGEIMVKNEMNKPRISAISGPKMDRES